MWVTSVGAGASRTLATASSGTVMPEGVRMVSRRSRSGLVVKSSPASRITE